jgi:2-polyprenyl-3-methyl-5-hydroxy-6-metoxy-1,4-benzoquinol methylase
MITFAQLKHINNKKFKKLHQEVEEYHKKVGYFFDWSRQWEYPWVLRNTPYKKKSIVLDVGGGTSHFPAIVSKRVKKVVVGELYSERVWKDNIPNIEYLNVDITKFKTEEKYDIVSCISVLEHIEKDEDRIIAISNLAEAVKKGGYLVMTLDLFLDNTRSCKANEIQTIIKLLSNNFKLGKIDLNENNLYQKITLQEMKLDMPNLYSKNYKNRTSLGIVVKKI